MSDLKTDAKSGAQDDSVSRQLLQRLNDPEVAAGLNQLLDRLDTMAFMTQSVDGFLRRGETIADSVTAAVDEVRPRDPEQINRILERAPHMMQTGLRLADAAGEMDVTGMQQSRVLQRLTDPETLKAINQLLDRLPLLAFLTESLEGFLERGDTVADSIAGMVKDLNLQDLDSAKLEQWRDLFNNMREAGEQLLESGLLHDGFPQVIEAGKGMVESGMLDKGVVNTLGELGKASTETYHEVVSKPIEPVGGIFGLMRAVKDPDVQKTMGFAFAFAKAFAKHIH